VSVRKVTLGPGNATDISIQDGLKPGERVVIDGADKLKEGAKVLVREAPGSGGAPAATPPPAAKGAGQHRHRPGAQAPADHGTAPATR
jgi:membrane fusion protein, multidrug efflux system